MNKNNYFDNKEFDTKKMTYSDDMMSIDKSFNSDLDVITKNALLLFKSKKCN